MAYSENLIIGSYVADSDLSEKQYRIVKVAADDKVDAASASTDDIIGVLQGTPESGYSADIAIDGVTKVLANGALSAGDLVTADSDGKAQKVVGVPDVSTGVLGDMVKILGKVVEGAGDAEYASVLIDKMVAG